MDLLSVNHNTCELGFTNGGIPLKNAADVSDRYCTPKYVLRMTTEIGKEASGELKLYFSNDGGVSFYNKEEPRIATWVASEDEIHSRRAEVCVSTSSSCFNDGEVCTVGNGCKQLAAFGIRKADVVVRSQGRMAIQEQQ